MRRTDFTWSLKFSGKLKIVYFFIHPTYSNCLGHSSGGAVACLVFLLLLEKFKDQSEEFLKSHFKCITFGLMPLADNSFKQYVESIPGARDCFCHIVQKNDIVPKLFGSFNTIHMQVCFHFRSLRLFIW